MSIEIGSEKELVLQQIEIIERLGSMIPRSLKNKPHIVQLRTILKLTEKHLSELYQFNKHEVKSQESNKIYPYVEANTRIKNHVLRKGFQIKQMLQYEELTPFVNLALKSLSKIVFCLDSIEKKIRKCDYSNPLILSQIKPFHNFRKQSYQDTNDL